MNKYAVVIGISDYDDPDIVNINFSTNDAKAIGECLQEVC